MQSEMKSFQGLSYEYELQVFESVSQSSKHTTASIEDVQLHQAASLSQIAESTELSEKCAEEPMGEVPKILLHLQDLSVKCGDMTQFLCVVEDESSVDITWIYEGVKLEEYKRVKQLQYGNIQSLPACNVQLVDQGLYSCIVHNECGEKTMSAVLRLEGGYWIFSSDLLHFILITSCSFSIMQIVSMSVLIKTPFN